MNGYFAWARDLGEAEQGRVLLALGLLPPSLGRSKPLPSRDELAELLLARWTGRGLRWHFSNQLADRIRGPEEALRLEQAAKRLVQRAAQAGGLRLEIASPTGFDDEGQLLRLLRAGGAASIRLLPPQPLPPAKDPGDRAPSDRGADSGDRSLGATRGDRGWPADGGRSLDSWPPADGSPVTIPRAEPPVAEKVPTRYFQARVEAPGGQVVSGSEPLRPESVYSAAVFIGARAEKWLGLGVSLEEPPPDPGGNPLPLQVVFWEPRLCAVPQVRQILLPRTGDTDAVHFPLRTAGAGILEAGIAVYYRNRVLQAGTLRGRIGEGPCELSFSLAAAPVPEFDGLEERAPIDASFLLSRDAEGRPQTLVCRDDKAAVAEAGELLVAVNFISTPKELKDAFGRSLEPLVWDPEDYGELHQEGTRRLLVELARRGYGLLRSLRKHAETVQGFESAEHLQIVQQNVDDFLPVEFLYDGPPPHEDARICRGRKDAAASILDGRCCGAIEGGRQDTVCPLRFWSLSKVIERHAHLPEHSRLPNRFQLRRPSSKRRTLDPLAGVLLAANYRVDAEFRGTTTRLKARLAQFARASKVVAVTDWAGWRREVQRNRPQLLVLLPHHGQEHNFDSLELGRGSSSDFIEEADVISPEGPALQPVVLLIGCGTASAMVQLESFVAAFQDAGAAIVVSTLASILGRRAGPTVEVLVEEIYRIQDRADATFGEAMLAARRRLLAQGTPMVLGLTSYGDADWRIARGS